MAPREVLQMWWGQTLFHMVQLLLLVSGWLPERSCRCGGGRLFSIWSSYYCWSLDGSQRGPADVVGADSFPYGPATTAGRRMAPREVLQMWWGQTLFHMVQLLLLVAGWLPER